MNPNLHTSPNVLVHAELVREKVAALALANSCSTEETALLDDLAMAHDIGKVQRNISGRFPGQSAIPHSPPTRQPPHPEVSETIMKNLGETDTRFLALVRHHDEALPWYQASMKGSGPDDSAWKKLAEKLDLYLLSLFMIADRSDCPGGWRKNPATIWFLDESRKLGCLRKEIILPAGR